MNNLPPPPSGNEGELDVEDAFGDHDIEYWVWSGNRLVPASPDQIALIREREALLRLQVWAARKQPAQRDQSRPRESAHGAPRPRRLTARFTSGRTAALPSATPKPIGVPPHAVHTASGDAAESERPRP